jgi:hypothetical protein
MRYPNESVLSPIIEKALITTNQRIIASLRKTAAERYLEFLKNIPTSINVSNH